MAETFYDVLGVKADAEESAIDAAFRERIKEVHPDVNDSPEAEERSRRLIEAKEVLTDEAERARYDRLGHDQYVRQADTDASWATGTSTRSPSGTASEWAAETDSDAAGAADPTWAGRDDWRHRRRRNHGSRRTRDRRDTGDSRTKNGDRASSSDGSGTDRTAEQSDEATANAASASVDETQASAGVGTTSNVGGSVGWAAGGSHAVRNEPGRAGVGRGRLFPATQSVVLLVATFFSYPGLVFSSVYPGFSPVVNVIVAACTLALIVYLASMPEVGIYVFGGWTVFGTFVVLASTINPLSPVGLLVLGVTWLPLGLTVLTYWALRW